MTLNVPLLRKVMDHIEAHPEEHDQSIWARKTECGTTYCFAGWAVVLNDPAAQMNWTEPYGDCRAGVRIAGELTTGEAISDLAADALGLTDEQSWLLFHGCNAVPDLRRMVDGLIASAESSGGDPCAPGKSASP